MEEIQKLRLFDLLDRLKQFPPREDALAAKINGQWKKFSSDEYIDAVNSLAYWFIQQKVNVGDKIGLIANNCPEWNFVDFACLSTGAVNTPLYPTISEGDLTHVIKEAEIKYFFVSNEEMYQKVKKCAEGSSIIEIFTFQQVKDARSIYDLMALGKKDPKEKELAAIKAGIKPGDLATLIYTSGTTGYPKGVMLSHYNFTSNVLAVCDLAPFTAGWRSLSFLPLNHVFERMIGYLYLQQGVGVYYAESMETIAANLKEVKPHMFVTVPRLLEKVYDKIVATGSALTGIKKKLFFWALRLGLKYELHGKNGWWYEFQLKIANKLIFSKWREALGGNVQFLVSGGSALQPRLLRVFHSAQIKILEGYGLTETSPCVAANNYDPKRIKIGTVGPVLKNVQVKLAEDGEIYVKGPNVMLGYYKQPELTAEVIDKDGWFHTGDIGVFEDEIFLKITDRKKEIFKTSGGKYVAPQKIENKLKESRFIEQAMVIGENEKFPAAFIVPTFATCKEFLEKSGISCQTNQEIIQNEKIIEKIREAVENTNKDLAQHEKIKKFELLFSEWTIQNGEMTPKLSLKRKVIMKNYANLYSKIYGEKQF